MSALKDLIGQRFGRLAVIARDENAVGGQARWRCQCDCGEVRAVRGADLRFGKQVSCGCYVPKKKPPQEPHPVKHGHARRGLLTATYRTWAHMKERCSDQSCADFVLYGGRGIKVCDRWLSFENFLADMGDRPAGTSIDRINGDGHYEPGNCRWATAREQANNWVKRNRRLTFRGETLTLSEWARRLGIAVVTLQGRLDRLGWDLETALTTGKSHRWSRRVA